MQAVSPLSQAWGETGAMGLDRCHGVRQVAWGETGDLGLDRCHGVRQVAWGETGGLEWAGDVLVSEQDRLNPEPGYWSTGCCLPDQGMKDEDFSDHRSWIFSMFSFSNSAEVQREDICGLIARKVMAFPALCSHNHIWWMCSRLENPTNYTIESFEMMRPSYVEGVWTLPVATVSIPVSLCCLQV